MLKVSIKNVVQQNDYDHIFVIIRLGNEEYKDDIKINDWIGLQFNGLLWNRVFKYKITKFIKKLYYKYDTRINTFPEEVFLHEFLHSLERTAEEYGLQYSSVT